MSVDLRERLRRALGPPRQAPAADEQPDSASPPGVPRDREIHHLVPGAVLDGPHGACFVGEQRLPLHHRHGDESLGGFFEISGQGLGCLARLAEPLDVDPERILFLDTETTGLSGGTGTYVFLVGVGFFRDDHLVVRQVFMRHHAEEPAMLAAVADLLADAEAIVTFNGKSFDMPLLMTRFTANRQRRAFPSLVHLDLLHPSRRFWRDRLEACNLGTLERAILGHTRVRDIPSWMIPDLYFRYVRGADPAPMARVFEHNLHDVLSLVTLACRMGRLLDGEPRTEADVHDLFAAARIYDDLGLWDEALSRYERALTLTRSVTLRASILGRLAALCKRSGQHERAMELWRRLATLGLTGCEPLVELAKHYEHRLRDYDAAIAVVEEALTLTELQALRRQPGVALQQVALEHRHGRLLEKRRRARGL